MIIKHELVDIPFNVSDLIYPLHKTLKINTGNIKLTVIFRLQQRTAIFDAISLSFKPLTNRSSYAED